MSPCELQLYVHVTDFSVTCLSLDLEGIMLSKHGIGNLGMILLSIYGNAMETKKDRIKFVIIFDLWGRRSYATFDLTYDLLC